MAADITVRLLGADDWQTYREIRLQALREAPDAFVASAAEEEGLDESVWRERMSRSRRLLAEVDGRPVGVASVGQHPDVGDGRLGEIFGLWVAPEHRGSGVARRLLDTAASVALDFDHTHLVYWVGSDNGRAVAFASSIGFRPTDGRRPMHHAAEGLEGEDDVEVAMVLALGADTDLSTAAIPVLPDSTDGENDEQDAKIVGNTASLND